ncbi:MAG: RimJ/RimL family protein N-acetyltransferase [Granulosicoccus sp.]|jgi:RimJ/RimL family protein N-acetyltransferase
MQLIFFSSRHFDELISWFPNENSLIQWGGPEVSYPIGRGQLQSMLDEGQHQKPIRLCWMATDKGAIVGHSQLLFDWKNEKARLCRIAIAPESRGQGLAKSMLTQVINRAFGYSNINRLELNVYTSNQAAIRTYKHLGFVDEGANSLSTLVGDKHWEANHMALLRSPWSDRLN